MKAKEKISGRELNRRREQSRGQWAKDNPVAAYGLKKLYSIPRAPIGRGL